MSQAVHLDACGLELDVGRAYVYVRSEVAFIVGEARYCAGVAHRVQARGILRVWPMGDRAGAVLVYR
jgi:hypothetical protein